MDALPLDIGRTGARRPLRVTALLFLIGALVVCGLAADHGFGMSEWRREEALGPQTLAVAAVYVVLLALPFVPAIEIGFAIMLALGRDGVVLVYVATQIALVLAFACGRLMPAATLAQLGWQRPPDQWTKKVPSSAVLPLPCVRWTAYALSHRYLALAALNLPGNAAVGGAGGIAFLAGASRLYSFPRYCLLVAAATSPLPLLMLLCGTA